jgi:hypothetical protein
MARYGKKASEKVGEGDARAQERKAQERTLRQEGEEPETGDCHWVVTGASCRRQGAAQKVFLEEEVAPSRSSLF